jgi:lipopolysaccharide assembly outer membrane protein LptD (OstA)
MKRIAFVACIAGLAFAQTAVRNDGVLASADRIQTTGAMHRLSGHVEIETATFLLQVDQADYNPGTKEIRTSGDVRIKLK